MDSLSLKRYIWMMFLNYCILVMGPYTDERRDVLENTPPEAREISQRRGFCTPRPERLPEVMMI